MTKLARPMRGKDAAAIRDWVESGSLVDAYRQHVARDPDSPNARQAASLWAKQPHIRAAVEHARQDLLAANYGSVSALMTTQLAKFEAVFKAGMKLVPDVLGVPRPENLPAALGAVLGITKLFAAGQACNATKLAMLRQWLAVQSDIHLDADQRKAIEAAITEGIGL